MPREGSTISNNVSNRWIPHNTVAVDHVAFQGKRERKVAAFP